MEIIPLILLGIGFGAYIMVCARDEVEERLFRKRQREFKRCRVSERQRAMRAQDGG